MKKKDKVTLKGVDKPEPFQHWTETINGRKAIISYQDLKTSEVPVFNIGIDPYNMEPIDNPQKPQIRFIDPVEPPTQKEVNGLLNTDFEHTGEEVQNSRGFFTSRTAKNSELKPVYTRILKAMVMDELINIKSNHPEVLEQFIKEHYGK